MGEEQSGGEMLSPQVLSERVHDVPVPVTDHVVKVFLG